MRCGVWDSTFGPRRTRPMRLLASTFASARSLGSGYMWVCITSGDEGVGGLFASEGRAYTVAASCECLMSDWRRHRALNTARLIRVQKRRSELTACELGLMRRLCCSRGSSAKVEERERERESREMRTPHTEIVLLLLVTMVRRAGDSFVVHPMMRPAHHQLRLEDRAAHCGCVTADKMKFITLSRRPRFSCPHAPSSELRR